MRIAGERDPTTDFYQERFREWHALTDSTAVVVLDEAGHFFIRYRATELATILTTVHTDPAVAADTWRVHATSHATSHDQGTPSPRGPAPSMRRFLTVALGQWLGWMAGVMQVASLTRL